jgi:hypothetical protein
MLKLTLNPKILLVIFILVLVLASSENFVACIPGVFLHLNVQVSLVLGTAGVFFYTMKRAVDWHFREDTYRSKTTFTSGDKIFENEVTMTGGNISFTHTHTFSIPGTNHVFESTLTRVNKPKYLYPLHEGKPGSLSDPSLFNVFEYLR